ncbi:hypothetical protein [Lichenibacterium ramalinae]|uniref:Uncharacterized protein n=1 Tax=Lichenibacterium ramalinae TaxID=2316527 RepID=A0A4Q2RJ11_9HYPH|nr:hypothetical protein [Lichenibacterium ramalinae]RYB07270.1 hypothetical protein D3272_04220 [Lichenibacterium ramalinae]
MSTDPLNIYSRSEIAAGARHFAHVADDIPGLGKKALGRAERQAAAAAEVAADHHITSQLDRYAGAAAATRALAPARQAQGRGPADLSSDSQDRGYTLSDVEALRARMEADEPAARRGTTTPRSASHTQAVVRDWAEACIAEGSPEARKAGEILARRHGIRLETR